MAKVFPFRGLRYNPAKIKELSLVTTQPYDKIKDKERDAYYKRHEYNYVRIIKGVDEPNTPSNNVYTRAAAYMQDWLKQQIFIRDEKPGLYVYHQVFTVENYEYTRKGFMALVEVQEPGSAKVKAHEKTLAAPKLDRLNLTRAIGGHTEHIFMLYPDPENKVNKIFDPFINGKKPLMTANDEFNSIHKVWYIADPKIIKQVQDELAEKDLFIADGHHRYETSVNYWLEMKKAGVPEIGNESIRNCLMTLIGMEDSGLVVLATHRLIHSIKDFNPDKFLIEAIKYFEIEHFSFDNTPNTKAIARERLFRELDRTEHTHVFGVAFKNVKKYCLLRLRDERIMSDLVKDNFSTEWKNLDVSILHTAILDALLGIDAKALEQQTNVVYERGREETLDRLENEENFQIAFLLNPTKVSEVKAVAANGERMPQKSTDFYPKLLSGLVFNLVNKE
jgi:uncharacterized protein (DUF1015 family)